MEDLWRIYGECMDYVWNWYYLRRRPKYSMILAKMASSRPVISFNLTWAIQKLSIMDIKKAPKGCLKITYYIGSYNSTSSLVHLTGTFQELLPWRETEAPEL